MLARLFLRDLTTETDDKQREVEFAMKDPPLVSPLVRNPPVALKPPRGLLFYRRTRGPRAPGQGHPRASRDQGVPQSPDSA